MLQPNLQIKAFSNLDKVLRISEYRVTYQVDDTTNQVIVTTIAHRSNPHSAPLTVTNGDYGGKLMKKE
jgi:hypothetical protein